ncbi:hypothetical protein DITRI_Ditri01bG0119600 [Diplodiscus trichospermus]
MWLTTKKMKPGKNGDMETEIAMRWTKLLRTGVLGVKFMGIDLSTIMFNLEDGQKLLEILVANKEHASTSRQNKRRTWSPALFRASVLSVKYFLKHLIRIHPCREVSHNSLKFQEVPIMFCYFDCLVHDCSVCSVSDMFTM